MTRLAKLRTMGLSEVGSRVSRRLLLAWERRSLPVAVATSDRLRRVLREEIARQADWKAELARARRDRSVRWFGALEQQDTLRRTLLDRFRDDATLTERRARRICEGQVELFGRCFQLDPRIEWHAAPGAESLWPQTYHADIDPGEFDPARGDVKDVWELNRHQWLLPVAKAHLLSGDTHFAGQVRAAITSWIEANQYGLGVNWAGPLEVAYRALSWIWMYPLVSDAAGSDHDLLWLSSFADHGEYLSRHLEIFSSPYNHLIGEASVLYQLGVLFPELRDAERWRSKGRQVLESQVSQQFYRDGGSVEQATVYHHATLGFYLLAAVLGRHNREEFSAEVWSTIERATEFSMTLTQPDGRQPAVGDNDDARPLPFGGTAWDFRCFQSIGAVLFDRSDFKCVSGGLSEAAVWLLGPDAVTRFDALPAALPRRTSTALERSGYVVLRSNWAQCADYVLLDCGEQAGGLRTDDVPSAAHGHADALSVVVHLGGEPVLVDPGFYSYNGPEPWERFFRETAAHNTVTVAGRNQAHYHGRMSWSRTPDVTLEARDVDSASPWATAAHDGFVRSGLGIRHRRTVRLAESGLVVMCDELTGAGEHVAEAVFQFAPGLEVRSQAAGVEAGPFALVWVCEDPVEAIIHAGVDRPDGGWVATRLGGRDAATRLVLRWRADRIERRLLTAILDRRSWKLSGSCTDSIRLTAVREGRAITVRRSSSAGGGGCPGVEVVNDVGPQ